MKKSLLKRFVMLGVAAAFVATGVQAYDMPTVDAKVQTDCFDFQPHRGGRDARPENTLYSYAYAMEMGATSIECDMQMTKDGVIVMSHNPVLNHDITKGKDGKYVENGKYDIRTMTYKELQNFTVGDIDPTSGYYEGHGQTQIACDDAKIPTLEQLFQLINEYSDKNVIVNAETKLYPDPAIPEFHKNDVDVAKFVKEVNRLVKKYNMEDRFTLQTFDWRSITEMKKINPNITTVALWCQQPTWGRDSECLRAYEEGASPWLGGLDIDDFKGNPYQAAKAIGADIVSPYGPEISLENIQEAHALGMKIVPWTVNDATELHALLDMGVDGIITDKPWMARPIIEAHGLKLNPPTVNANSKYHTGTAHNDVQTKRLAGGADASH